MENDAKGCEVIVSGKIRGQRAKAMKFADGMMIHSGNPVREYVEQAVRHVEMRQGMLGIKVKILKPHDPEGFNGPKNQYPDVIEIIEPKVEKRPEADKGKTV
jgi:small subunit ribosomal protein S3e